MAGYRVLEARVLTGTPVRAVGAEATVRSRADRAEEAHAADAAGPGAMAGKAAAHQLRFSRFSRASLSPTAH